MSQAASWPIHRVWKTINRKDEVQEVPTEALAQFNACVLLGGAGMGKTTEMKRLARSERSNGRRVREFRMAEYGTALREKLDAIGSGLSAGDVVFLDSLDEVQTQMKSAALVLAGWMREVIPSKQIALRISCRPAVWPKMLTDVLREFYPDTPVASLESIEHADIGRIAASEGASDAAAFLTEVQRCRAMSFAGQPLALQLLIRHFKAHGNLPPSRIELFQMAAQSLARERQDRRDAGTAGPHSGDQILETAERVACFMALSGKDVIDLTDIPSPESISLHEMSEPRGAPAQLDHGILAAVGSSGLCSSEGEGRFRFLHRQLTEYLAGRRLARLLPHQAKALLANSMGVQAGVAGPLRETAAFAAAHQPEIATWISSTDPEVIGMSEIGSPALRRQALLGLLNLFRHQQLTDDLLGWKDSLEFSGFQYQGIEADLRAVLVEAPRPHEDVLECVLHAIRSLELATMSDDLVMVILDATMPFELRMLASYALVDFGTVDARQRLRPFLGGDDPRLRGVAIRALWPGQLNDQELLDAMRRQEDDGGLGDYEHALILVDRAKFDASNCLLGGLSWVLRSIRRNGRMSFRERTAKRIAHRAARNVEDMAVLKKLALAIAKEAKVNHRFLLSDLTKSEFGKEAAEVEHQCPITHDLDLTKKLCLALAGLGLKDSHFRSVASAMSGHLMVDLFPWLLQMAVDANQQPAVCDKMAWFAVVVRGWHLDHTCVSMWYDTKDVEPVKKYLGRDLSTRLNSREARNAKRNWLWEKGAKSGKHKPKKVVPPPAVRVQERLALAESKDVNYFYGVIEEMTLEEDSAHYGHSSFLSSTPGWESASVEDRARIVEVAKKFLLAPTTAPEDARHKPFSSILSGYMPAFWLLLEQDRAFIELLPLAWWERWAYYILRELHPNMSGEPNEPKDATLNLLRQQASNQFRHEILGMLSDLRPCEHHPVIFLLDRIAAHEDMALDASICRLIADGKVPKDRQRPIARFVLDRSPALGLSACLSRLNAAAPDYSESEAADMVAIILCKIGAEAWQAIRDVVPPQSPLWSAILRAYAMEMERGFERGKHRSVTSFPIVVVGQITEMLMELFPPEKDPKHQGAYSPSRTDDAISLRNKLVTWLGDQGTREAIKELKRLEAHFGARYPWLRRPRSRAERALRLSDWTPNPISTIAEILHGRDKRLIRGEADGLDGIAAALNQYEHSLRHQAQANVEDLWNTGTSPAPKSEERASDKIRAAIHAYFNDYAVSAAREVQISRRLVSTANGGARGSEVDVFFHIPARSSAADSDIQIPIEVKRSCNPEAKTGLQEQLVDRYMNELGTCAGVFVVVWFDAPNLGASHRPVWPTIEAAKADLEQQVVNAKQKDPTLQLRVIVIDATLR